MFLFQAKSHCLTKLHLWYDREIRPKEDVQFLENGTAITYKQPKSYVFQANMSVGSENDTFVSVNLPILVSRVLLKEGKRFSWFEVWVQVGW